MRAHDWGFLFGIVIVVLMFAGWVMNIIALFSDDMGVGELVLRAIGVVVPFIGAVVGWF